MTPALAVLRVGSCDVPKLAGYGNGCRALREHAHVMVSKEASVATGVPTLRKCRCRSCPMCRGSISIDVLLTGWHAIVRQLFGDVLHGCCSEIDYEHAFASDIELQLRLMSP